MQEIREVLRRRQAGHSVRRIAREMGLNRRTVARYLSPATMAIQPDAPITDEVTASVCKAVKNRPGLAQSEQWRAIAQHHTQIRDWLTADRPLRLTRIRELLMRAGVEASYATLRRYAQRELAFGMTEPTVLLPDPPAGESAQIDFGLMGKIKDEEGRARKLWALIVLLPRSRYMFVWPTFGQTTVDICQGLDAAWRFFDGVPKHLILDNATCAVAKASSTDPVLNRAFRDYCDDRKLFADTARVRHPKDKARVENQVPYPRERWFAGELFPFDIQAIRASAAAWCRDVAGTRIHGTTRRVPKDVYELEEKAFMQPAPTQDYDVPHWTTVKVHPDHHAQVLKGLYSLPTRHIGKQLEARGDRTTVRFYLGADLVKIHPRVPPGKRSTDPADFPPHKAPWALRDVDSVVARAKEYGAGVGAFAERLLGGPLPWLRLRQGYALLEHCKRYGADRVDAHCVHSLSFDVIDVWRIERMLKRAMSLEQAVENQGRVVLLPSRYARSAAEFATLPTKEHGGAP